MKRLGWGLLMLLACTLAGCPSPETAVLRDSAGTALRLYDPLAQDHGKLLDEKSGYAPADIQGIKDAIARLKALLLKMSQDK